MLATASVPEGLEIVQGVERWVLDLPRRARPLEATMIEAALGVVTCAPPSDGRTRALELLAQGDEEAVELALRVLAEACSREG